MYTYHHVIRRLTEAEKIRLLTDLHSLSESESLGVPRVICASLREGCRGDRPEGFPTPAALARSWDAALMGDVAAEMTRRLAAEGVNHVVLPPAGSALVSDGVRLSEDPCLSGTLSEALLGGVDRGGLTATAAGYGFTSADRRGLDSPAGVQFTADHLEAPYGILSKGGRLLGLILESSDPVPEGLVGDGCFLFRRSAGERETIAALLRGELLIKGSAPALQGALHTYRRIKAAMGHGKATMGELEAAVLEGAAVSEETLNDAVDRLLTFAAACCDRMKAIPVENSSAPDPLHLRALDGATVLLENHGGLLPLVKPTRICILGDLAREGEDVLPLIEALNRHGHTYIGFAWGYDPSAERNDRLTAEAVTLASQADVILLFAKTKLGQSRLPAAHLALLDQVGRLGKKTVVVLSSDVAPDMGFIRTAVTPIAGLLLTPLSVKGAALHAVETLLGDRSPRGRLTETLIDAADPTADRRGYKVGPFVGYRYYDTLGYGCLYPFGHGLSYTRFRYSALKIRGDEVTFTVRNVGKRAGAAVPQLYVGMEGSSILRPKKELTAFACIHLAPGEKATVTLPKKIPHVYHTGLTEQGSYRLSVGESVSDIRLTVRVRAGQDAVEPDDVARHEYLPSVSNILTERYTLEAEYTPMKPSLRNLIFGIAALALAVSVKIYDIVSISDSMFLNIVAGLLAVGSVFFFVLELLDRKKQFARERAELEEANTALFAEAADIPVPSADALFDLAERTAFENDENGEAVATADEVDHFLDADKELTFPAAISDFTTLAVEKGLALDGTTARSLFAAMAASRLLVTHGVSDEDFSALVSLLCEYFGCPTAIDKADESYIDEAAVLYGRNGDGETVRHQALDAIEAARRDPRTIRIVALTNVSFENVSDYFVPYARYARAPHSTCSVTARDGEGTEVAYLLPENLWFVLNLCKGEGLHRMPDYLTEVAVVLKPGFDSVKPAATHTEFAPFRYGQMLYLCDRLRASFSLEEDTWKRIDRLEAYAARFGQFSITNKLWLEMEAYLSVLLTTDIDPATALDEAMAVKLLPALIPALSGNIPREERGLSETLDAIFGEGNTPICRRTVRESGTDLT